MTSDTVDLLEPAALARPHDLFARLRREDPISWSQAHRAWIICDYDGVVDGFRDVAQLSSDRLTPLERRLSEQDHKTLALTFAVLRGWMTFNDAPQHAMLRDPVREAFTPRRISDLRPRIETVVEELLGSLPTDRAFDFKEQFAFPMPAIVIAELLGIPTEDRERFKTWSKKLSAIVFGESGNPDQAGTAAEGSAEFVDYFRWLIAKRVQSPGDDLVSALIAARRQADESGLTDMQVVGACTLLLFAGHETTTNLITNATLSLLRHPDQAQWFATHPDQHATALEELLRHDGPVKVMVRTVAKDHERGGHTLREGQIVYLAVMGANRDPAVFPEPDRLDLQRPTKPAHVGFGQGPHYCLGHALARMEASIALSALFRRYPQLRLADRQLTWDPLILVRSLESLRLDLGA